MLSTVLEKNVFNATAGNSGLAQWLLYFSLAGNY